MVSQRRALVVFLSAVLVLSLVAALFAQEMPAPTVMTPAPGPATVELPPGVIAMVNGEAITEAEWVATLKRAAGMSILDVMIRHKLVNQAAAKRGVTISEAELQVELDKIVAQAGGIENLMASLRQMGETPADFKSRLKTEALLRKLVADAVSVTDEELQMIFAEQYGKRAEVQVIVVGTQPEAENVLAQAKSGADFSQLAMRFSTDAATGRNHGYLPAALTDGIFPKPYGNVVITKPMADTIFALKPGEVSGVIAGGQGGFFVFKMGEFVPARDVKFEMVKDEVRTTAQEMKTANEAARYLQTLMQNADVQVGLTP